MRKFRDKGKGAGGAPWDVSREGAGRRVEGRGRGGGSGADALQAVHSQEEEIGEA